MAISPSQGFEQGLLGHGFIESDSSLNLPQFSLVVRRLYFLRQLFTASPLDRSALSSMRPCLAKITIFTTWIFTRIFQVICPFPFNQLLRCLCFTFRSIRLRAFTLRSYFSVLRGIALRLAYIFREKM